MSFLAELRRRNVIRMAGLYLVGAWLVVQVAETLLPIFGTPDWVLKALVVLLAIGVVPALVFSWIYELTPDGLKRDADVDPAQSIASTTGKRMDRLLLVGMLVVIGAIAADRWWPKGESPAPPGTASTPAIAQPSDAAAPAASDPKGEAAGVVRGIAVLPFDNLSPDPDNAFFAGGVYEEVLTKLSRINELRVISRTSMERIAKDDLEVGAIGQRLGVSHVLEGSVRRAGDQIRVTVQLIEAATDAHVWAENYDRKLDDVFAIQSEIALAIAGQLEISLSPQLQANINVRPTQNQAAYALYLRALDERRSWRAAVGFQAIIDLLEPAVAADADFLDARVLLAEAYGRMAWLNADPDGAFADKARRLVADIVQRWPEQPQREIAQGHLVYNLDRDYARALIHFEAARERLPNDPTVLSSLAGSYKRLGRDSEFLATIRRVVEIDPESAISSSELMLALIANDLLEEGLSVAQRARARFPDDETVARSWAYLTLVQARDSSALLARESQPHFGRDLADIARYVAGDLDALVAPLPGLAPDQRALLYRQIGRAELLRLGGRDDAAQARIDEVRAIVLGTPAPEPRTATEEAISNAAAAVFEAMFGEADKARALIVDARIDQSATPAQGLEGRWMAYAIDALLADAERRLGDPEAAWRRLQPYTSHPQYFSHGELRAFGKYYDALYGESPSYRAYMAKIGGEQR